MHALKGILLGLAMVGIGCLILYSRCKAPQDTAVGTAPALPKAAARRGTKGAPPAKTIPPASYGVNDPTIQGPTNPSPAWIEEHTQMKVMRKYMPYLRVPTGAFTPAEIQSFTRPFDPNDVSGRPSKALAEELKANLKK